MTAALTMQSLESSPAASRFVSRPGFIERILAGLMLFVYSFSLPTDWFVVVSSRSARVIQGGSPLTTLAFLSFFGIAILAIMGNWHLLRVALAREPLLGVIVGLIGLSTFWSENSVETATTTIVLIITLTIGLYFTIRFRLEEIIFIAGVALAVGLVLNYLFVFALPQFGLDRINVGSDGLPKWSGVFLTKNELGRIAALSLFVFGFNARLRRSFAIWPLLTLLALVQVAVSNSATALGTTGGLFALLAVFLGFRGRKTLYGATAVSMVTIFSTLTLLAATDLATATGLVGRGATFTGRIPLWSDSWNYGITERLWTGYGWLAYWAEPASFEVRLRANFETPHAHNAFIDAWLYAGPIASLVLLAIFIRGLVWGARNIRTVPGAEGLIPIMLISYGFIFSLTEAGVVRRDISFVLFVIAIVTAAKNKGARVPWNSPKVEPEPDQLPARATVSG